MKKLSLVAIATVLAAPAFADPVVVPVGVNVSTANGVNVGSVSNIGINNFGGVTQNTGFITNSALHLDSNAINQGGTSLNINPNAYTIGSIVGSGNGGAGGGVDVIAVNAAVALSRNDSDQRGIAAAVAVPVAIAAQGVALQDATTGSDWQVPVNLGLGRGKNEAEASSGANALQANLSQQKSITAAVAVQDGVANGIDANGGAGKAFIVTINSNNTAINNTSVSKISLDTTVNIADRGGVAGGLKIEDSFNPLKIEDSLNGNAVAVDEATAVAVTANGNKIED